MIAIGERGDEWYESICLTDRGKVRQHNEDNGGSLSQS